MIEHKVFWRGNPHDGTVSSGSLQNITTHDTGAQCPTYRRWRIDCITVVNMTPITAYYTVALFHGGQGAVDNTDSQVLSNPGALNTATLPQSIAGGPGTLDNYTGKHPFGWYLAFSEPVGPVTTRVMPIVGWALGDDKLWVGAYPGGNELLGTGGVSMQISGREYRG